MDIQFLKNIIDGFAKSNLIFTNEQDFQFEFARALDKTCKFSEIKLEAISLSENFESVVQHLNQITRSDKEYTDILLKEKSTNKYYALELKFKTPEKICVYTTNNGKTITMSQGGYINNAYLFINDIKRLENINNRFFPNKIKIEKSYAILLTNDKNYRFNNFNKSKYWKNYSLFDGRQLNNGTLAFANCQKNYMSFNAITLLHDYKLSWNDYALKNYKDYKDSKKSNNPGFSYLIVEVNY